MKGIAISSRGAHRHFECDECGETFGMEALADDGDELLCITCDAHLSEKRKQEMAEFLMEDIFDAIAEEDEDIEDE